MIGFNDAPEPLVGKEVVLGEWLNQVAKSYNARVKGLTYSFLNDAAIAEMNVRHLNHDYATDIITFGYSEGRRVDGEVFIGFETVQSNAVDLGVEFFDELCRVIVHGLLHLIGFDDQTDDQKKVMRNEEEKCLILRPKNLINNNL